METLMMASFHGYTYSIERKLTRLRDNSKAFLCRHDDLKQCISSYSTTMADLPQLGVTRTTYHQQRVSGLPRYYVWGNSVK